MSKYSVGIDYGTLSARAVVVSCDDGRVLAQQVFSYPHGVIAGELPDGTPIPDSYALADAKDYREALFTAIRGAVEKSGVGKEEIAAIGIDATTYTMVPCLRDGTVLSELAEFSSEPMAYIKLWKHQGAAEQASRIEALFKDRGYFPVLRGYGGSCNCEFAVPKLLETREKAPEVFKRADMFCDLGEWIALTLTGNAIHSAYSAGFKCMWHDELKWPAKNELNALSEGFGEEFYSRFAGEISGYEKPCGYLSAESAEKLGLLPGTPVAAPMGDGSTPGVYFCLNEPDAIAITVGTSIAMAFASDKKVEMPGINGVTFGGIVPGRWSYDAGTPCAGDMLDWFCRCMVPKDAAEKAEKSGKNIHAYLSEKASAAPWDNSLTVLDWWNGNRSILNNMSLRGSILGLSLSTATEDMYCAFVQSIGCSIRTALEHFELHGIHLSKIIFCGGIPLKNAFVSAQIASILGKEIYISKQTQVTAVSAAILGAASAGMDIKDAAERMADREYICIQPDTRHREQYDALYGRWKYYHDLLGRTD